jgi:hypothetical protein
LERHRDPLAGSHAHDAGSHGEDFCSDLVSHRVGAREEAERRHRDVEVAARDRKRTNHCLPRAGLRVRGVLPFELAGFDEDQLLHINKTASPNARRWRGQRVDSAGQLADHVAAVVLFGEPSDEFLRENGVPAIAIGPGRL